jgi:hypothetical protein
VPPLLFVFGNSLARKQIDEEEKTRKNKTIEKKLKRGIQNKC